ncbi:MAG: oxaloacetate decarboxylase [Alphaproteobacteria bacterium]|nr:oxaloacetate decarboxylase [Alphaproteobacteria bacterium]
MNWTDRRTRFRAILSGTRCVHPASVFDAISARIAEDLGFEIGMFAGSVASMTVLGAPDLVVLSLTEFAEQAYRINRAGSLPLLVDADHGYGNALSVKRTVEELETAGVAGLTIEDTALPARFGKADKTELIPIEEGVGKMRAALAGRQDPSLVVCGRTSALGVTSVEDTVARAKAYEQAGVDAMFLSNVKSRAQLDAVSQGIRIPIITGGTEAELIDLDYLASRRVRIWLLGHQPFLASVRAVHDTLKALRDGMAPGAIGNTASADLMNRVVRREDYARWSRDFLGGG